jgi:hypothetical protein
MRDHTISRSPTISCWLMRRDFNHFFILLLLLLLQMRRHLEGRVSDLFLLLAIRLGFWSCLEGGVAYALEGTSVYLSFFLLDKDVHTLRTSFINFYFLLFSIDPYIYYTNPRCSSKTIIFRKDTWSSIRWVLLLERHLFFVGLGKGLFHYLRL